MKTLALVLVLAACADVPGDPKTLVVGGTPFAGYAWSGPGGFMPIDPTKEYVGWSIVFTNTSYCPTGVSPVRGSIEILTPDLVAYPSTQLPALPSNMLPIQFMNDQVTSPQANLYIEKQQGEVDLEGTGGTLTLTTFTEDEVDGTFTASSQEIVGGAITEIRGTFKAPRCSRIHD